MLEPRYEVTSVILVEFLMGPNGGLGVKESWALSPEKKEGLLI